MSETWQPADTTTHQDHVIAHVIGTTVLGDFVLNDAVHLLLDIGFIWKIYVDGEMGLLPHPVAVAELEIDGSIRNLVKADIELLLRDGMSATALGHLAPVTVDCRIVEVAYFVKDDERKLLLAGENANLEIETVISDNRVQVTEVSKQK